MKHMSGSYNIRNFFPTNQHTTTTKNSQPNETKDHFKVIILMQTEKKAKKPCLLKSNELALVKNALHI